MSWLLGWGDRVRITVSSPTTVSDYQVKITVGESVSVIGVDIACSVYYPDFKDIRFTLEDGVTLLPYWIEDIQGTTPSQIATIWVKLPEISENTFIYLYYGSKNPDIKPVSDAEETLLYFDDATTNAKLSNYSIATVVSPETPSPGNATITWLNGEYTITITRAGCCYAKILPLGMTKNIAVHTEIMRTTTVANQEGGLSFCVSAPNIYGHWRYISSNSFKGLQLYHYEKDNYGLGVSNIAYSMPLNQWKKEYVGVYSDTAISGWYNSDYTLVRYFKQPLIANTQPGYWGLFGAYDIGAKNKFRKIFARNYVFPEPAIVLKETEHRFLDPSEYLIQQFKDSVDVPRTVNIPGNRLKDLILNFETSDPFSIDVSEGDQLNEIGKIADAGRGSLTDVQYRDWILYIQGINASGGGPDVILGYIRKVLGDSIANILFDEGNAAVNIQLITQGVVPASTIEALVLELGRIVPAGVEVRLFHSEDGYVFAVADEGGETTLGYGFSEEDNEPPTGRTTGGRFIDPIRVGG